MKEILVFIAIVIIALIALSAIENSNIDGANLLGALKFDFTPDPEDKKANNEVEEKQPKDNYNPAPAPAPAPTPAPTPTPSPEPENSEPSGYTTPRKPEALSLYYQKIKITGVTKKSSTRPSVIRLKVYTKEDIDLTGFIIQTRHGEFEIPEGMEKYKSSGVEKNISSDEYITLYLIAGQSPLNADAFRLNTCFGYLKQYNDFYPSISSSCPRPELQDIYHLNPYCQDYILGLRRCEIPSYMTNLKIATNSYCTSYITENLNYPGCFKNYKDEDDFLKNYWYIYTKTDLVEPLHDIIQLYDQKGYLVDDYTY